MKQIIILSIIINFFVSSCLNIEHKYVVTKSSSPRKSETLHTKYFSVFGGLVPIDNDLSPETVCPGRKLRMVNMYNKFEDALVCGLSITFYCPQTVGIECVD